MINNMMMSPPSFVGGAEGGGGGVKPFVDELVGNRCIDQLATILCILV